MYEWKGRTLETLQARRDIAASAKADPASYPCCERPASSTVLWIIADTLRHIFSAWPPLVDSLGPPVAHPPCGERDAQDTAAAIT